MRRWIRQKRHGKRLLVSFLLSAIIGCVAGVSYAGAVTKTEQRPQIPVYITPEKPTVYLTFDDGPSVQTDEVLDILSKEDIKATFFVVGAQADKQPDRLRHIAEQGHAIGNHSYNHVYSEIYSSFKSFAAQVVRTNKILKKRADVTTRLLRAPGGTYGNFDKTYFDALNRAGYIVVDWSVDSGDAKRLNVPAKEIAANLLKAKLKHEMIVLMHDGGSHKETVKALPLIIKHFKKHGYSFAPLSDQVNPQTFRLAKTLKWKRANPSPQMAVAWLGGEGAALPPPQSGATPEPSAAPAEGSPTAYVPLRDWVREAGGSVSWDPNQGIVHVIIQGYQYKFYAQTTQVEILNPEGGSEMLEDVPLVWQKGILMLPADQLQRLFGPAFGEPGEASPSLTLP